jgi:hypothetical protein
MHRLESWALEPPSHQIVGGARCCEHFGAALAGAACLRREHGVRRTAETILERMD